MPYNKHFTNRKISDLGLFVQTSPYRFGLYKKIPQSDISLYSLQTSRSVNKKLI